MWLFSDKVLVRDSGLLDGFRDCHCHLLPGVDDGVQEVDETMQILEEWESLGVKEVWLTPHIMEDIPNEPEELKKKFETLTKEFTVDSLPFTESRKKITLHQAAEHMMDGLFLKRLEEGNVVPYNSLQFTVSCAPQVLRRASSESGLQEAQGDYDKGSGKLLVETSYYTPPMNMGDIIERIKSKGYEPILAHPERYQYMDKPDYNRLKQRGVLLQLNLPSLVGAYGPLVMKKAEWLLKENMYDYCGSDTHSMNQVELFLSSEISKKIVKKVKKIAENQGF